MLYFYGRAEELTPRWVRLRQACRDAGVEVAYTVIQSATRDGRDRGLDYRISGFHVPPGCWDAQVCVCVGAAPLDNVHMQSAMNSALCGFMLMKVFCGGGLC